MKITLDIPDGTICAFFDFVRLAEGGYGMQGYSIDTSELYDGSVIKIDLLEVSKNEKG